MLDGPTLLALVLLPWFGSAHRSIWDPILRRRRHQAEPPIGYSQISLGQAGFAIGAFTFGHWRRRVPIGSPSGRNLWRPVRCPGRFPLRLRGLYLAIVTLGFGIAVYQTFTSFEVLSGAMGLVVPISRPLRTSEVSMYYFALCWAGVYPGHVHRLVHWGWPSSPSATTTSRRDPRRQPDQVQAPVLRHQFLHGDPRACSMFGFIEPRCSISQSLIIFVAVVIGGLASVEGDLRGRLSSSFPRSSVLPNSGDLRGDGGLHHDLRTPRASGTVVQDPPLLPQLAVPLATTRSQSWSTSPNT